VNDNVYDNKKRLLELTDCVSHLYDNHQSSIFNSNDSENLGFTETEMNELFSESSINENLCESKIFGNQNLFENDFVETYSIQDKPNPKPSNKNKQKSHKKCKSVSFDLSSIEEDSSESVHECIKSKQLVTGESPVIVAQNNGKRDNCHLSFHRGQGVPKDNSCSELDCEYLVKTDSDFDSLSQCPGGACELSLIHI